jgi:hypothetical protein
MMSMGPDVEDFISAAEALLQSITEQELSDEEAEELMRSLLQLAILFPPEYGREAA